MPRAWRIVHQKYTASAFDGEGARRVGGRFNSIGTPVVYCADSLALAVLEVLVHLPSYRSIGQRVAYPLSFDETLVTDAAISDLPRDWRRSPPGRTTQAIGDDWVRSASTAVLRLPSVIVLQESNYILNPHHLDFDEIEIGPIQTIDIDPRLLKSRQEAN